MHTTALLRCFGHLELWVKFLAFVSPIAPKERWLTAHVGAVGPAHSIYVMVWSRGGRCRNKPINLYEER